MKPLFLLTAALLGLSGVPAFAADGEVVEQASCIGPAATYEAAIVEFVQRANPSARRDAIAARFPEATFEMLRRGDRVQCQRLTYLSDGLKVIAYLVRPVRATGERFPAVIYNRGGNRDFGQLALPQLFGWVDLALQGYVVIGSQYRGNDGGEGREEFGGREINDVLALIPLIESLPYADHERIGMYGWSRGGLMTYLALTRTTRIRAAIVGAGVVDSFEEVARRPEMEKNVYSELVPNWTQVREEALLARSPIRWVNKLHKTTPILLLHGSADWRVSPTQGLRMASALYEAVHPVRFVFFEGGDHGLTEYREEVDRLVLDWLNYYVKDKKPWPSLEPHGR
jgi:dipeptidyl aminopeptidase/acylaminoacyl peptidase